jgi:hypothetical protein
VNRWALTHQAGSQTANSKRWEQGLDYLGTQEKHSIAYSNLIYS